MTRRQNQLGMGMLPLVIIMLVILFFGVLLFRIGPIYIEYFNLVSSMKSLQEDKTATGSVDEPVQISRSLRDRLMNRLQVNDVDRVSYKDIVVKYDPEGYHVQVAYEAKVRIMYNIYAMIKFDREVLVKPHAESQGF